MSNAITRATVIGLALSLAACGGGNGTGGGGGAGNSAPAFTSAATASVAENAAGTVYTATAADSNGDPVTFSISGGADAAQFDQGLEAAAARHHQVEHHHVRVLLLRLDHRFVGAGRLGDHLDLVEAFQQPFQAGTDERVVIAKQDAQQK